MTKFNINFGSTVDKSLNFGDTEFITLGRVQYTILDRESVDYINYGEEDSIGAVKYIPIGSEFKDVEIEDLPIAYPCYSNVKTLPLKNEIVLIVQAPSGNETDDNTRAYYLTAVNIFNNINNNSLPLDYETPDIDQEDLPTNKLLPFYGDTIIEGRLGNSVRFSGYNHSEGSIATEANNGNPFIIISNGRTSDKEAEHIIEDINKDESSIYLTSKEQKLNLIESTTKYEGTKTPPIAGKDYKGSQIIINSGRLYFNSKEEDILFSAKESFGVSSNDVSIDGKDYIGLDAKKIYIGKKALDFESQPAVLGDKLEYFLNTMLKELVTLGKIMTKANAMGKPIPALNKRGPAFAAIFRSLQSRINPGNTKSGLKSKKVFIE